MQLHRVDAGESGQAINFRGALSLEDADKQRRLDGEQSFQPDAVRAPAPEHWLDALAARRAISRAVSTETRRRLSAKTTPMKSAPASLAASASSTDWQPQIFT